MRLILRATCPQCGERIGVYEPTLVIDPNGTTRITSLAHEPDLLDHQTRMLHARCGGRMTAEPRDAQ